MGAGLTLSSLVGLTPNHAVLIPPHTHTRPRRTPPHTHTHPLPPICPRTLPVCLPSSWFPCLLFHPPQLLPRRPEQLLPRHRQPLVRHHDRWHLLPPPFLPTTNRHARNEKVGRWRAGHLPDWEPSVGRWGRARHKNEILLLRPRVSARGPRRTRVFVCAYGTYAVCWVVLKYRRCGPEISHSSSTPTYIRPQHRIEPGVSRAARNHTNERTTWLDVWSFARKHGPHAFAVSFD